MILRQLGSSSLTVSALGFGAGHIDTTDLNEKDAHDLLDTALDLGITFFDTARGYGASEERLGRWLATHHRHRVVLSTKVGYDVPGQRDWTVGAVTGGIDRALKTLNTEMIDVVFLHSCPLPLLQQGDLIEALLAARDAGKIRVPGYSGENAELAWAADASVFGILQTSVNLTDQHSLRNILPRASEHHLGVVAKRPLANAPWRYPHRPTGIYGETYWDRLQHMGLQPADGDWAGTALRFSAFTPAVTTAIVGTSKKHNLAAAATAINKGPLPAAERERWEQAFAPYDRTWAGEI
ncbi:aldo/keto reductase [Arthrobacter sp. H5]|uniref:aldo/keto reductase n=1 Tax=Arthrobacter sp. H5 TaxID=1267973 RepID=UPI0004816D2B|nr:aldo/keto reductase [Arthrobacter sp. H5]